jgi:parvulin-like peptidyl-prolyl isomerase
VLSGYGTHVVYVSSIREPPPPVFSEVRERVVEEWTSERSEELNEQFYANLRESYTIVIESPAVAEEVVAVPGEAQ